MDRRSFLRAGIMAAGGGAVLSSAAMAGAIERGASPYGSLDGIVPDENGIILPPGFRSGVVAVAGEQVGDTDSRWRAFPDGAGVSDDGAGGWYLAVNSEVRPEGSGGVGVIHFGPDGEILDAFDILSGSRPNCASGSTPWASSRTKLLLSIPWAGPCT